jgi:hypothetical protein
MSKTGENMISFYIERQPYNLFTASFYGKDNEYVGKTTNISVEQIDSAVNDIFPDSEKVQIFEKPDEL